MITELKRRARNSRALRMKLAAAGTLAAAAVGVSALGNGAIAAAEAPSWDLELFQQCLDAYGPASQYTILQWVEVNHTCCLASDGVWDEWVGECYAPPATVGSRHIPGGLATAPPVSLEPPHKVPPKMEERKQAVVVTTSP
jgi:hypothetical protein